MDVNASWQPRAVQNTKQQDGRVSPRSSEAPQQVASVHRQRPPAPGGLHTMTLQAEQSPAGWFSSQENWSSELIDGAWGSVCV